MARRGRPLLYETVEKLEADIEEYFESCFEEQWIDEILRDEETGEIQVGESGRPLKVPVKKLVRVKPISITGLAMALNTSRETLMNYEHREEYFDTIRKAKDRCENFVEDEMFNGKINPVVGIFNAKNNFGWEDRVKQDIDENVVSSINIVKPAAPRKKPTRKKTCKKK